MNRKGWSHEWEPIPLIKDAAWVLLMCFYGQKLFLIFHTTVSSSVETLC